MRKLWMGVAALALAACGEQSAARADGAAGAPSGPAAAAVPAMKSESKTFRDWYAVCDNGNLCAAYSGGSTGWILIQMDAGPAARPTVRVGMWPEGGDELKTPISVVIDGKSYPTSVGPDDTSSARLSGGDAHVVITQLAAGHAASLSSDGQTVDIPVAGISASLLWFDERQGRLDTTTALIRKGTKPASAVPAAPDLPHIVAAPAVSQTGFTASLDPMNAADADNNAKPSAALEAVPAIKSCREGTAFNEYLQKSVTASRLNATTELWGIPCDSGAYNASYAYYLTGPGGTNPRLVNFPGVNGPTTPTGADGDNGWLVNPAYDPATRTLTAFAKGRGLGDCGVAQSWTWTGQAFVLNREQVMSDCWGMVSDFWPTTFRSR
jgi:hypothetical protein